MEDVELKRGHVSTTINDKNEEISFFDLFAVLWRRKKMIIVMTLIGMVGVIVFSIVSLIMPPEISPMPNQYTSSAYMLITDARSPAGVRETLLGFAAYGTGGFTRRGTSYGDLAIFLLGSNSLLDAVVIAVNEMYNVDISSLDSELEKNVACFVEQNNVGEVSFSGPLNRRMLRERLDASFDYDSRVLTIGFTHIDPVFVRDVVNFTAIQLESRFIGLGIDRNISELERLELNLVEIFQNILLLEEERRRLEQSVAFIPVAGGGLPAIVADINRKIMEAEAMQQVYTQLRIQHEVLRVNITSEIPMFQILEFAEISHERSKPNRARLCIIVTLATGFFSMFLAFVLEVIDNIRKDPLAMAKLRGTDV